MNPMPPLPPDTKEMTREYLRSHDWSSGLIETYLKNLEVITHRFFILDDSGSMMASDGSSPVLTKGDGGGYKKKCTRWQEMGDAVRFHAELADVAKAPSEFMLLNSNKTYTIGVEEDDGVAKTALNSVLDNGPGGVTPLCGAVRRVIEKVKSMEKKLRDNNQRVSVTIFSDGQPSDGKLAPVLNLLHKLPVWCVIRMCTDSDSVTNYYNDVDSEIELEMDVIDDFFGEAHEVMSHNPWVNYCLPIHRIRENGCRVKVFDHLDEKPLTKSEMTDAMSILVGGKKTDYVAYELDPVLFKSQVAEKVAAEQLNFNPRIMKAGPIINLNQIGGGGCCVIS